VRGLPLFTSIQLLGACPDETEHGERLLFNKTERKVGTFTRRFRIKT
jgi:hypothetical protein